MAAYMNLASKYSLPDTELTKSDPFTSKICHCAQWVEGWVLKTGGIYQKGNVLLRFVYIMPASGLNNHNFSLRSHNASCRLLISFITSMVLLLLMMMNLSLTWKLTFQKFLTL